MHNMANVAQKDLEISNEHIAKKRKLESNSEVKLEIDTITGDNIHSNIKDLSKFKLEKILNNSTRTKSVCLQGTFSDATGIALIHLEKSAFEEKNVTQNNDYFSDQSYLKKLSLNDIYGNYEYFQVPELNAINVTIIHPATQKHILKYCTHDLYIVNETPEIYENIVLPYITKEQLDLQWVHNILDHLNESDRIVFEDTDPVNGFVLLPDLKWNGTTFDTLYLLAIANIRNIKSLRDLKGEHVKLLKNIYDKSTNIIEEKYGIRRSQLRVYLHYQPTFYHLHVHFTYLRHEAPGILVERAHLLSNVINNIELLPDYYQKVDLPFTLKDSDKLFKILEEKGIVKKSTPKSQSE